MTRGKGSTNLRSLYPKTQAKCWVDLNPILLCLNHWRQAGEGRVHDAFNMEKTDKYKRIRPGQKAFLLKIIYSWDAKAIVSFTANGNRWNQLDACVGLMHIQDIIVLTLGLETNLEISKTCDLIFFFWKRGDIHVVSWPQSKKIRFKSPCWVKKAQIVYR